MSDNPYAPPGSQIGQSSTVQGQMARPWQVVVAVRLALIVCGINFAVSLANWSHYLKAAMEHLPRILISTGITIWLYYRVYCGRNWARIVLLLGFMGGAIMLPFEFSRMPGRPVFDKALPAASVALSAVVIYFLFISPGRHWFRRPAIRDAYSSSPENAKPESRT